MKLKMKVLHTTLQRAGLEAQNWRRAVRVNLPVAHRRVMLGTKSNR